MVGYVDDNEEHVLNKYKKLLGDSIIYLIGNIGSKVISVMMVSFYSFMLTPEQFGKIDVTQTTISLILPFITLCIHDAVLRFCLKSDQLKPVILSNGTLIVCFSVLVSIPLCFLMDILHLIGGNVFLILFLVVLQGFNTLFSQYCRGVNKTKVFVLAGIVFTFIMAASNIIFLKYLEFGINGYFLSMIVGYVASIVILMIGGKIFNDIHFELVSKNTIIMMVRYSVPLIPNSIMWWLMNAGDKYVIMLSLGNEANGIYAVAGKIPTILSTFTTIFMQAWQVSAISESDSKDKNAFYSKIFNSLSLFLFLMISAILIVLKPLLSVLISSSYTDTWRYVPFLLISTVFSSFSAFLGTNYTAMRKTGGALKTTFVGGVLNVILNFAFISLIGLNGAAVATAISFFVVWLLRIRNTKQFVQIEIEMKKFVFSIVLLGAQIASVYLFNSVICAVFGIIVVAILLIINFGMIKEILHVFTKKGERTYG